MSTPALLAAHPQPSLWTVARKQFSAAGQSHPVVLSLVFILALAF